MGLDNGFILKKVDKTTIPKFVTYSEYEDEIEVVYWRKCWGLRNAVLNVLHASSDKFEFQVEAEDIPAILRAIYPFFSEEYWEEHGESIWLFEEKIDSLVHDVIDLAWLETYLTEHPEVECYFYDSY